MVVCFFLRKRHVKKNKEETEQKPKKTLIELFFYVFMVSLMFFQLARRAQIQFVELTLKHIKRDLSHHARSLFFHGGGKRFTAFRSLSQTYPTYMKKTIFYIKKTKKHTFIYTKNKESPQYLWLEHIKEIHL